MTSLKTQHPNLYLGYLMNGTINLLIGLFGLLQEGTTATQYAFIALYVILGLLTFLFTVRYNPTAARIVLISGLFYNSFFVFIFFIGLFLSFDEVRETAYVIPLFLGHALATYIIAVEPPTNPATMKDKDEVA